MQMHFHKHSLLYKPVCVPTWATHTHTHTLSLSLSLTHTHTHAHTHTDTDRETVYPYDGVHLWWGDLFGSLYRPQNLLLVLKKTDKKKKKKSHHILYSMFPHSHYYLYANIIMHLYYKYLPSKIMHWTHRFNSEIFTSLACSNQLCMHKYAISWIWWQIRITVSV